MVISIQHLQYRFSFQKFFQKLFTCLHHTPDYYPPLDDLYLADKYRFNNRTYFNGTDFMVNLALRSHPYTFELENLTVKHHGDIRDHVKLVDIISCLNKRGPCENEKIEVFFRQIDLKTYVEKISNYFKKLCRKIERLSNKFFYFCVHTSGQCESSRGFF